MGYRDSLEKAGATVHLFEQFGDWQGTWWAKVTWKGETGWVSGSYGSCEGCDAFQAEFGWLDEPHENYDKRLADFGTVYLEGMYSQEKAEARTAGCSDWDEEGQAAHEYIVKNGET